MGPGKTMEEMKLEEAKEFVSRIEEGEDAKVSISVDGDSFTFGVEVIDSLAGEEDSKHSKYSLVGESAEYGLMAFTSGDTRNSEERESDREKRKQERDREEEENRREVREKYSPLEESYDDINESIDAVSGGVDENNMAHFNNVFNTLSQMSRAITYNFEGYWSSKVDEVGLYDKTTHVVSDGVAGEFREVEGGYEYLGETKEFGTTEEWVDGAKEHLREEYGN